MATLSRSRWACGLVVAALAAAPGPPAPAKPVSPDLNAASAAAGWPLVEFRRSMDAAFGAGRWRETSGFRSRRAEDILRARGAGTVPPGHVSRHSLGRPAAPGAYDAVVPGLPLQDAAALLRSSAGGTLRVLAEAVHGPEGAHLHIEPTVEPAPLEPADAAAPDASAPVPCDQVYLRIIHGAPNPLLATCVSPGEAAAPG